MDEKNTFRLDETILQNRKKSMEEPEIIIDMDDEEVGNETIHIEIGEMDYDPEDGQWKDSHHGWRVHEEEKEADYRQLPDPDPPEGRALVDKRAGKKAGKGKKEKTRKEMPLYLQVIYGLVALACLGFCFVYPYHYLNHMIARASEFPADTDGDTQKVPLGTYCTLKSNSLDGVPVFGEPGTTTQTGFIPEGKYVQLLDNRQVDGKDWGQIDYCGITAWIPMKQLHFINDGDNYIKVGILYGTEFTVLKLKDGWAQVDHEGQRCWINMFHMGSYGNRHWKVETLSKAQAINLRKEPDGDAGLYCKVPENQELEIKEFRKGWGLVDYENYTGWVMLHYLIPVEGD